MTIVIVMKSGKELRIKCKNFTTTINAFGVLTNYKIDGITENKPIYMQLENIEYIYRVVSDEEVDDD